LLIRELLCKELIGARFLKNDLRQGKTMTNNDILKSIRYTLNITDAKLVEIIGLAGLEVNKSDIESFLKKEDEFGYKECNHSVMGYFLNGLILYKRGKDENKPVHTSESFITNNIVLKKLRVAFELKDNDIIELIRKSGLTVSKTELGAFFRKSDHRNYRECGDQFLRNLLLALSKNPSSSSHK
jgi:uncharacterized protein YehS (DUF1456 family)